MLRDRKTQQQGEYELVLLEELVPQDHFLRAKSTNNQKPAKSYAACVSALSQAVFLCKKRLNCSSQQKLDTPTRIFRQPALRNCPCIVSASDIQENRQAAVR